MALISIIGSAPIGKRFMLGQSIQPAVCEILGNLKLDSKDGECSVLAPAGKFDGKWAYYIQVSCDPNENREEYTKTMAREVLTVAKELARVSGYDDKNIGVWLDIGTRRFWAQ